MSDRWALPPGPLQPPRTPEEQQEVQEQLGRQLIESLSPGRVITPQWLASAGAAASLSAAWLLLEEYADLGLLRRGTWVRFERLPPHN